MSERLATAPSKGLNRGSRGLYSTSFPKVLFAMTFAVAFAYGKRSLHASYMAGGTISKCERNAEIRARHKQGESLSTVAEAFCISEQWISQIVHYRRK